MTEKNLNIEFTAKRYLTNERCLIELCTGQKVAVREETRVFFPDGTPSPVGKTRVSLLLIFFVLYTSHRVIKRP
ncbi:Uncharacterized protein dnm_047910 [Desulfonema magnum]|uniref:Uncharacterized protein n=1 Tax=Desulfonema magnum TaxID=45655 RepID=A0A975BN37_9BACT|nr:Uncharacterized protein dnm_047910 [Desulfonema magnum]